MKSNYAHLQFILDEILRFKIIFQKMNKDTIETYKDDVLFSLPHPSGHGTLIIGRKAERSLEDLAKRAHQSSALLKDRSSVRPIKDAIKHVFVKAISKEGFSLTKSTADKIVSTAIKHVEKTKINNMKHFYPCILFEDDQVSQFSVGPVIFTRTPCFLKKMEKPINEYTNGIKERWDQNKKKDIKLINKTDNSENYKIYEQDLLAYYSQYPWIAEIEINGFEKHKSQDISGICIKTALNILQIFLPWKYAEDIRIAYTNKKELKTASLIQADGKVSISLSRQWDRTIENGWVGSLFDSNTRHWLELAGSLISKILLGSQIPILYQRYINALWWFGEALSCKDIPYLRIISLSNALEAFLSTTGGNPDISISDQVANRAALLLSIIHGKNDWVKKTKHLYKTRSDLVHGRTTMFDQSIHQDIFFGMQIVQGVLIQSLEWMLYLSHNNLPTNLQEIHDRFEKDLEPYATGQFCNG